MSNEGTGIINDRERVGVRVEIIKNWETVGVRGEG